MVWFWELAIELVQNIIRSIKLTKDKEYAIKTLIKKLQIRTLVECKVDEMVYSHFNMDTDPDFPYDEYFNCNSKSDAFTIAEEVAKRRWSNSEVATPVKRNELFPCTYKGDAINKKDLTYEDGDEITTGPVYIPEFHVNLQTAPRIDAISFDIREK